MEGTQAKKTACFVITYERPQALLNSLKKISSQTCVPTYILILDNSVTDKTEKIVQPFLNEKVRYLKIGYNSGPAGAAKKGLKALSDIGFDYLFWSDDDNPPRNSTFFAELLDGANKLESEGEKWGIVGGKGGRLNYQTGRISSLSNNELKEGECVEVDSIPGGHGMLINAQVIKSGILPDESLFFGFEEFDFCLKAKSAGFRNYVVTAPWLKVRKEKNETSNKYRWKGSSFGKEENLKREYYSTRNLLQIFYRNRLYAPCLILLLKSFIKMPAAFRFGRSYGNKMARIQFKAVMAFLKGKFGQYEELY